MDKRHISRILAGVAATAMIFTSLAGCGSSNSGSASAAKVSGTGTDDGTTLTLWTRAPLEAQAKNVVSGYNSSHKNKIKLEIIPNDDMEGKVGGAAQTDSLPDILAGDVVRVPNWASQGIFTDLTKQIDSLDNLKDLQQGHIKAGTVDGKKYTLPFVTDVSVMVWNKKLFKQAGLDPDKAPQSISEFTEDAKKVAALNQDGVSGSYLAGQSGGALTFDLFPTSWADDQAVISKDGKKALLNNSSMKAVLDSYRELASTKNGLGAGSKEETGATWTAPFQNGKVGIMPYPGTTATTLFPQEKKLGFEIGVAPIPGAKKGTSSTYYGGDAIGVSKDCKHVAQAWNFMHWLMSEKAQTEVFAKHGDTASNTKTLKNAYKDRDPRVRTVNQTIIDGHGETPIAKNFNAAFNAAGSPFQILIQDYVWGSPAKLNADNANVTKTLSAD